MIYWQRMHKKEITKFSLGRYHIKRLKTFKMVARSATNITIIFTDRVEMRIKQKRVTDKKKQTNKYMIIKTNDNNKHQGKIKQKNLCTHKF